MPIPKFDPTINLGHVLSIVSFIIAAIAAYHAMKADIEKLELRMVTVERSARDLASSVTKLTDVIVVTARQDEQLRALRSQVERLERARVN